MANLLDSIQVFKDPYGVVLVMGAWNLPIQLTLLPVIAAIAAGNCVIIKPSEVSKEAARVIENMIPRYLDNVSKKISILNPMIIFSFDLYSNTF